MPVSPLSLCIEHLRYSVRSPFPNLHQCRIFKEHLSHAFQMKWFSINSFRIPYMLLLLLRRIDASAWWYVGDYYYKSKWLQVSVRLLNATDKPLSLEIWFLSRDLDPTDRPTCMLSGWTLSTQSPQSTKLSPNFSWLFERITSYISCCNQCN